jgi:hypothetical protein
MPRTKISEFSSTPANNTDIDSINISEGCAPSGINDAIRELMAQLKDFQVGSAGDPVTVGGVLTVQAGSASTPALTTAGDTNTGMFFPAADTIAFAEGGAEIARFDSSGNLGLGVTPSAWSGLTAFELGAAGSQNFCMYGGGILRNAYYNGTNFIYKATAAATLYEHSAGAHRWYNAPSGTAGNAITFTQAMTLSAAGGLSVGTTTDAGAGNIWASNRVYAGDGSAANNSFARAAGTGTGMYFPAADTLGLSTSGAERARITSDGVLLVGITSAFNGTSITQISGNPPSNQVLSVRHTGASPNGMYLVYSGAAPNGSGNPFFLATDNSATRFEVRSNGGIANYSANNVNLSDRREKTNFAPAKSYLDTICAIPVQTFNYLDQNIEQDGGLTLGVVAQDVQAVAPELVMESDWGTKEEPKIRLSIYQTDLQYALMKCIQEQQAIIENLKARLDAANL